MILRLGLLLLCVGGICCNPGKRVIVNAFGGNKGVEKGGGGVDDEFKGTNLTHTRLPSSSQVDILGRRRRGVSSSEENDYSGSCFVTSELAYPMTKVFQRIVDTFTQKVDSVKYFEDATKLETILGNEIHCEIAVSRIKTSAWFILNRVWLATSCQYPDEKGFQAAYRETVNEIRNVDRFWRAFDIPEDVGCLYELKHCTSEYPAVMRSAFKEAVYKMEHVQNTGMCKMVDVKQVTDTLEDAVSEIRTLRKALESQGSTTKMALAAVAAQKQETEDMLRAFEALKSETRKSLTGMESSNTGLKKIVEDSITRIASEKTCCSISGRASNNTVDEELRDLNLSNSEAMVRLLHDLSSNETGVPSWTSGIQAGRIDEIVKVANLPYVSLILMGHIERLVAEAYSFNPGNIAAVIKFVEQLADKKLKLEAYKALFAVVDHKKDMKESVRVIYKLVENWKKYNGSQLSTGPLFHSFLYEHVHPEFVKLISGEYFNLACGHDNGWYLYLYSNPDPVSVLKNGAISNSPLSSERKGAEKWIWQFLSENDGSTFYLRNKLNSWKSFPGRSTASIDDNFVEIEPVVGETPVARLVKSEFTFSSYIRFRMRSVKNYSQYYSEGPHLSLGSYGNKVQEGDGQTSDWIPSFL